MTLVAITRSPGPELARCELTHLERKPIDIGRALVQHRAYQGALRGAGIEVIELPSDPALPDGVFVEDTAVILEEQAVITAPSPPSRRDEWPAIEAALRPFRPLVRLPAGAYLEGGDVLRVGRTLYVGQGGRTRKEGLRALDHVAGPLGYTVVPVQLDGCLHLKSACGALDGETLLVNRAWLEARALSRHRLVDVPAEESGGANVLSLPGATLVSAACPRTADLLRGLGHPVVVLDVSELHKAEAGLTCMSLVFQREAKPVSSPSSRTATANRGTSR
jgi:dimethylargininase